MAQTDYTTEATNDNVKDIKLFPDAPAVGDCFYVGGANPAFKTIVFRIGQAGTSTGTPWVIVWEYWNGATWTSLSNVSDGTDAFRNSGVSKVTFDFVTDWSTKIIQAKDLYWVRARITSFDTMATQPKATRIWVKDRYIPIDKLGHSYAMHLPVDGSTGGAQTLYQMRLIVHAGTGSSVAGEIYLNNHCTDFPNDIRFIDENSNLLDHWMESLDGNDAVFWIELDSIPADPDTENFFILYGKAAESSDSDGDATFLFFDDFDSGTYTKCGPGDGNYGLSNSIITITETVSGDGVDFGVIISSSFNVTNDGSQMIMARCVPSVKKELHGITWGTDYNDADYFLRWVGSQSWGIDFDQLHSGGAEFEIIYDVLNHAFINGALRLSITEDDDTTHQAESQYDWVLIRKYVNPEPTWDTPGSEF